MSNITQLIPNKDFTYKHLHRTDEGYVLAEPFIEVISGVYEGLKVIITNFEIVWIGWHKIAANDRYVFSIG